MGVLRLLSRWQQRPVWQVPTAGSPTSQAVSHAGLVFRNGICCCSCGFLFYFSCKHCRFFHQQDILRDLFGKVNKIICGRGLPSLHNGSVNCCRWSARSRFKVINRKQNVGMQMFALHCFCYLRKGYWSEALLPLAEKNHTPRSQLFFQVPEKMSFMSHNSLLGPGCLM